MTLTWADLVLIGAVNFACTLAAAVVVVRVVEWRMRTRFGMTLEVEEPSVDVPVAPPPPEGYQ